MPVKNARAKNGCAAVKACAKHSNVRAKLLFKIKCNAKLYASAHCYNAPITMSSAIAMCIGNARVDVQL